MAFWAPLLTGLKATAAGVGTATGTAAAGGTAAGFGSAGLAAAGTAGASSALSAAGRTAGAAFGTPGSAAMGIGTTSTIPPAAAGGTSPGMEKMMASLQILEGLGGMASQGQDQPAPMQAASGGSLGQAEGRRGAVGQAMERVLAHGRR